MINFYAKDDNPDRNTINSIISTSLIFATILFVPSILLYIFSSPLSRLKDPRFKERWEMAFKGTKTRERANLFFRIWYCLRRIGFVYSLFMIAHPTFQLISFHYMNIISTIYMGYFRPLDNRISNMVQLRNELLIGSIGYYTILFTPNLIDSKFGRYHLGWHLIIFVSFTFLINIAHAIYLNILNLRLICIKYYLRVDKKYYQIKRLMQEKWQKHMSQNIKIGDSKEEQDIVKKSELKPNKEKDKEVKRKRYNEYLEDKVEKTDETELEAKPKSILMDKKRVKSNSEDKKRVKSKSMDKKKVSKNKSDTTNPLEINLADTYQEKHHFISKEEYDTPKF